MVLVGCPGMHTILPQDIGIFNNANLFYGALFISLQ